MSHPESTRGRRALLTGVGAAALTGTALVSAPAVAKKKSGFAPKRHDEDAWLDALPGAHRIFIDADSLSGVSNALRYATNLLNAQASGYKGVDADLAIVVCLRHGGTGLGYTDAMWAKFGGSMSGMGRPPGAQAAEPATKNAQAAALAAAAKRGVQFAICDMATTLMSGMIARQAGLKAEEVHAELVANKVGNARMVPAGVMALTRAQEYGYSLLYAAS